MEHLEWKVYQSYGNPVGLPIDARELNWDKGELGKGNTLVQQNLKNGTKEGIETSRKLLNINYLELMKHVDHHWSYMILCTLQKGTTHGDWHEIWRWEGLGKKPDDALDDATFSWERDGWHNGDGPPWNACYIVLHRLESFCPFPVLWHVNDMRIIMRDVRCERDAWMYWRPQFELSPGSLLQNAMFWGLVLQRGLIALQKHLQNHLCFNVLERFTCWDLLCFAMQIAAFSIFWGSQLCKLPDPDSSDQRTGLAWGQTSEIWQK